MLFGAIPNTPRNRNPPPSTGHTYTIFLDFHQTTISCGIADDPLSKIYFRNAYEFTEDEEFAESINSTIQDAIANSTLLTRDEIARLQADFLGDPYQMPPYTLHQPQTTSTGQTSTGQRVHFRGCPADVTSPFCHHTRLIY